jgi:hypothetical protein
MTAKRMTKLLKSVEEILAYRYEEQMHGVINKEKKGHCFYCGTSLPKKLGRACAEHLSLMPRKRH